MFLIILHSIELLYTKRRIFIYDFKKSTINQNLIRIQRIYIYTPSSPPPHSTVTPQPRILSHICFVNHKYRTSYMTIYRCRHLYFNFTYIVDLPYPYKVRVIYLVFKISLECMMETRACLFIFLLVIIFVSGRRIYVYIEIKELSV